MGGPLRRNFSLLALLVILIPTGTVPLWAQAAPPIRNVNTGRGYHTISDALKDPATRDGHTIVVDPGVYAEVGIDVRKSITIKSSTGRPGDTVLQGRSGETIFYVWADRVNITGFTVRGAFQGIYLGASFCNIFNNILAKNDYGIVVSEKAKNNNVFNNSILNNTLAGIILYSAATGNTISRNNFTGNRVGINVDDSSGNAIYLNNFLDNERSVYADKSANLWNSPEKINYTYNGRSFLNHLGNYWSDYEGGDYDQDGIGDAPHLLDGESDNYPLVQPFWNYEIQRPRYYLKVISRVGEPEGEGWYHAGARAKVSIPNTVVEIGPSERYVFTGWSGDVQAGSPTVYIEMDGNKTVYANWKRQFYLRASTEVSSFEGGNDWYDENTTVTIKLGETAVGFLVREVFSHFEGLRPGDVVVKPGEVQVRIDGPREIMAVWRKDYTQLIVVAAVLATVAAALVFMAVSRRRRR